MRLGYVAVALSLFLLVSIIPEPFLGPLVPKIPRAQAATVPIRLDGFVSGWNASSTNPNPTITVHAFDTVALNLVSADVAPHRFLLDANRDGSGAADCLAPDPCSSPFPPDTTYTFSVGGIASGSYTYYCIIHPTSMLGSFVVAPDFSINASPPSTLSISAGYFATSQVTLTSSGFPGTVSLSSTVTPSTPTITTTLKPQTVTLTSGGSGTSTLNFTTTPFTPLGTYTVTVTGTSGSLSHSTPVTVMVTSGPVGGTGVTNKPVLPAPLLGLAALALVTLALTGIYFRRARKRSGIVPQA